jgi:hypothetical protein
MAARPLTQPTSTTAAAMPMPDVLAERVEGGDVVV